MSEKEREVPQRLLTKYPATQHGFWRVFGESENAGMGGPHDQPYLFTAEGTYEKVLAHAVKHRHFFSWGKGGTIEPLEIVKL